MSCLIIISAVFTCSVNTYAQIVLNDSPSEFVITDDSFSGITIRNTFNSFNTFQVASDQGLFTELSADKYVSSQNYGQPKVPVLRRLISIPVGAIPEVKIISSTIKEYNLNELGIDTRLIPAQPPVSKSKTGNIDFIIDLKAYNTDKFFGEDPASVEVVGILRNTRVARVNIAPVQYNPVTGILRVYEDITVKVSFTGGDYEATRTLSENQYSPYFYRLNSAFANNLPLMSEREYITQYPVKMVIVSDRMFEEALQPFIAWKIKKGFNVIQAYTDEPAVGNTTESIKSYLQNLYNSGTPEDPSPSFVLFVGDVAQIPAYSQGGHVTDLYYCEYTNDYFPEMYYGRFSATSIDQLQPQIDKTLMYEQYLFPDPAFLGECVMISGMDSNFAPVHGNGQINYGTTYYYNAAHGYTSYTYLYPESGSSDAEIIQHVSDGVGFANYTAHGSSSGWADPSFSISDIPGLQNDGEYPLMVGNCCLTSTYNTDCFGEELLRAANKGAIGYIGGSNSSYWDEDYYFGVGVGNIVVNPTYEETGLGNYDRQFHDHGEPYSDWYTTMDQIIFAGNLAVTEGSPSMAEYYWQIYCLMGDPSLTAYQSVPSAMTVSYDPLMPLSTTEFTVNAVPYAYVAISKEGVLYGACLADENGTAVVNLNPITVPGNADIVVTAQNKQPYIGTVLVASPDGPYVIMESQIVNDSIGNNNLKIDYAEGFGFNMTLKNVGNSDATNVTATISSDCPYISFKTTNENWGNIPSQASVNNSMAFELSSSEFLPDQCLAVFTLTLTDGTETWMSNFSIKLNAPVLAANTIIIDDSQTLIPNGRLDAGETVIIQLPVSNNGHSDAFNGMTYLFSEDPEVTITDNGYYTGDIPVNATGMNQYQVTIADTTAVGKVLTFFTSSNCDPYFVTRTYHLSSGLIMEDFETGDFTAFNWQNTSAQPWTINPLIFNSGLYSAKSGIIGDNSQTELSIQMEVASDDQITFARKVSSEDGYDFLKFFIDGVQKASWSGNQDWENVTFPVTAGTHTFKWSYTKDYSVSGGADAVYIDDIIFPSGNAGSQNTDLTVHPFAYPLAACAQQDLHLFAFVTNNTNNVVYQWQPAEMLTTDTTYNPVANISEPVQFTITIGSGFETDEATLMVNVNPVPEAPVISQQGELLISSATEGNQWYNSNGLIEGAISQTYQPLSSDYYYVTVTENGCESPISNEIYYEVISSVSIERNADLTIYPNPFDGNFNLTFNQQETAHTRISIIDIVGHEVMVLYDASTVPGNHNLRFGLNSLKEGVYFLKLQNGNEVKTRKIIKI